MKKKALALALAIVLCLGLLPVSAFAVSDWAQAGVTEATDAGIVPDGLPADFTQAITRAQFCNLAVTLYETKTGAEITGRREFPDTSDVNVQKMAYMGVVNGYDNGNFGPNDTLTREQAAAILSRLAGKLSIDMSNAKMPFTDVASTSWARTDIAKIHGIGVMMGISDTTFGPSGSYTIEQSILTMLRLYKKAGDSSTTPSPSPTPTEKPGSIVDSGTCGDNLTWTLDSNGTMTISGTGKMTDYENVHGTPWYSNLKKIKSVIFNEGVTTIGSRLFHGCRTLTSISIPKSVTVIGNGAFVGTSLTSVHIPEGVTVIDDAAFFNCNKLTSVNIPSTVTSIGFQTFQECSSLTSIDIPGNVVTVGSYAFRSCDSLTSVNISDGVRSIEGGAFSNCGSLTSLHIPDSVTSLGGLMVSECDSLSSIRLPDKYTYTLNSLDDVNKMRESLYTIRPQSIYIFVPAQQLEEYTDEVLKQISYGSTNLGAVFSSDVSCYLTSITLKNSEYGIVMYAFRYNDDGEKIISYHQGYQYELNESCIPLYERAKQILSEIITDGMSEYNKVKAIHDYIVNNTTYDWDAFDVITGIASGSAGNAVKAEGPLFEGKAVCEGYTKAFQLLCMMSNIGCIYVSGYASGPHAWNKVKVDGVWYNMDVTWDDPTGGVPMLGYDYFLISDSQLSNNHRWNNTYLPACPNNY